MNIYKENTKTSVRKLGNKLKVSIPLSWHDINVSRKVINARLDISQGRIYPIQAIRYKDDYYIEDGRSRLEASKELDIDFPVEIINVIKD